MTTRTDRRIAARRAAAPSVDFSLLPRSPELDALRALVDEVEVESATVEPPPPPAPPARAPSPVGSRFDYRARPRGDRTLQPFDPPVAHALGEPTRAPQGATAFVAAHLGASPTPITSAPRQSEIPTLILDRRRPASSPTLEPVQQAIHEQLDDEPTFPPNRGIGRRSQRLDTDLLDWIDDESTTLGTAIPVDDDVDPELDAWMRSQGRRRGLALAGALAAMIALCAAAMAGLVVMAGPFVQAPTPPPQQTVVAPPPAPVPIVHTLTVARGDTFAGLLATEPVDALAVHAAALPLHDLAQLEIGDTVVVELDPAGEAVREIRYELDDGRTLHVRKGAEGWTATSE